MAPSSTEITPWLVAWSKGDQTALDQLIPLVDEELRRLAKRYMRQERGSERRVVTLQTTALINEAYLRLIDASNMKWESRAHFFAIAARLMRRILVDYARSRNRVKRGGEAQFVEMEEAAVLTVERAPDLVALDDALDTLAKIDERKSRVVELRFFGGLSSVPSPIFGRIRNSAGAGCWLWHMAREKVSPSCDTQMTRRRLSPSSMARTHASAALPLRQLSERARGIMTSYIWCPTTNQTRSPPSSQVSFWRRARTPTGR